VSTGFPRDAFGPGTNRRLQTLVEGDARGRGSLGDDLGILEVETAAESEH
jgi:hypothetical protein